MDFNEQVMQQQGHGLYERLDPDLLALDGRQGLLHVMYADNPSDSGRVHADVKQRWLAGDPDVRATMAEVAECGRQGRCAGDASDAGCATMQSTAYNATLYLPCHASVRAGRRWSAVMCRAWLH